MRGNVTITVRRQAEAGRGLLHTVRRESWEERETKKRRRKKPRDAVRSCRDARNGAIRHGPLGARKSLLTPRSRRRGCSASQCRIRASYITFIFFFDAFVRRPVHERDSKFTRKKINRGCGIHASKIGGAKRSGIISLY